MRFASEQKLLAEYIYKVEVTENKWQCIWTKSFWKHLHPDPFHKHVSDLWLLYADLKESFFFFFLMLRSLDLTCFV